MIVVARVLSIVAGLLAAHVALADSLVGRVVGVVDGDTVDVLVDSHDKYRIRLAGIDAPEKGQPFGQAAKHRLSDLVMGRAAQVEHSKRDRYGRIVGMVNVGGQDAGLAMIRSGLAWHYVKYAKDQSASDRSAYSAAEAEARSAATGLWIDPSPVPPWKWRHAPHKSAAAG